jgi:hypothetical protein
MKFSRNIFLNYSVQLAPSPRNAPIKAESRNLRHKALKILCPKFREKLYVSQNGQRVAAWLDTFAERSRMQDAAARIWRLERDLRFFLQLHREGETALHGEKKKTRSELDHRAS